MRFVKVPSHGKGFKTSTKQSAWESRLTQLSLPVVPHTSHLKIDLSSYQVQPPKAFFQLSTFSLSDIHLQTVLLETFLFHSHLLPPCTTRDFTPWWSSSFTCDNCYRPPFSTTPIAWQNGSRCNQTGELFSPQIAMTTPRLSLGSCHSQEWNSFTLFSEEKSHPVTCMSSTLIGLLCEQWFTKWYNGLSSILC